jgi:hypothetical protein
MLTTIYTPAAYARRAMPSSFYVLTVAIAVGYFAVTIGQSQLIAWRARYREMIRAPREFADRRSVAVAGVPLIMGALSDFLSGRLWWWFAPALGVVAFWAGLVMLTRGAGIRVTPFVYTLF